MARFENVFFWAVVLMLCDPGRSFWHSADHAGLKDQACARGDAERVRRPFARWHGVSSIFI